MPNNDVHQNYRQPLSNYSSTIQSHPMSNKNNYPNAINNSSLTNASQFGYNLNNQANMQTKPIPPTPPPDSNSRCMTPSNINPGIC